MHAHAGLIDIHVRPGHPDFLDLPWHLSLSRWREACDRLVEVERGVSRHEVLFASYDGAIYAFKELPVRASEREYGMLKWLEERKLPAVVPAGYARARTEHGEGPKISVLITRFLDSSLPYWTVLKGERREHFRERLYDAISSLLVRLHLAGFYWGDCSLSNTLFRRDADGLQAYLVDAETSESRDQLSDGQRKQDIMIMMESIAGDLVDMKAEGERPLIPGIEEAGTFIRDRYEQLWGEISREEIVPGTETYRIHDRIRKLNELGFSVGEVELVHTGDGNQLRVRIGVTDRDHHRNKLHGLTGLNAGDRQAQLMLNEIGELRATLSSELSRSMPLSAAAYHWRRERYDTAETLLRPLVSGPEQIPDAYCQVLEHKWYLSQRAQRDVGFQHAIEDYVRRFQSV